MFGANVLTNYGADMVRALLAGDGKLIVTRAVGGNGVSSESGLPALTALPRVNQTLSIVSLTSGDSGPELLVRVASAGLQNAYTLRQIGIYAKLDDNGTETLFQVVQDENGVAISSESDAVGMTLDLKIGLAVGAADAVVTLDSAAYVTYEQLRLALGDVPRTRNSVTFAVTPQQWEQSALNPDGTPVYPGIYWYTVISNTAFSSAYFPVVLFSPASLPATARYGISTHCAMGGGELWLLAREKPETVISGDCHMFVTETSALGSLNVEPGASGGATWGALFGLS